MGAAIRIYAEFFWRRLRRGRFIVGSLVIALLPAVIAGLAVAGGRWGKGLFFEALGIDLRLLLPLAPMLLAAQAVGEELDQNTHTYLFARPAPRTALVLGKCLTTVLALLPSFLIGVLLTFLVAVALPALLQAQMHADDVTAALPALLPALCATAVGVIAYTGVAAGVGTIFVRRPLLGGFIYIVVIEELFGSIPGALKVVCVNFHLRAVAGLLGPTSTGFLQAWEPRPEPWLGALVAIVMGGAWLALALTLVSDAEYREAAK
jgi:hypothetical protein